ncbi:iron reductase domain protein, partial [Aplosporella prunicola CBS 121167]
ALIVVLAQAEPVQFCKHADPATDVNFCVAMTTHRNASTRAHDLYLTFTTTRHNASARGWTAVGPGTTMADALMFIVYGDPLGDAAPIVSVRTSPEGHHQPELVRPPSPSSAADLRVVRADWLPATTGFTPDMPVYDAAVALVCYACGAWPGIALDATAASQPWIWAWNPVQHFAVYTYDAHLRMHAHHHGNGGWGRFYLDAARSLSRAPGLPSLPVVRAGVDAVGAAEAPLVLLSSDSLLAAATSPRLHAHALFMGVAFCLLFPLGTVLIRSGAAAAFTRHWMAQAAGSVLVALGLVAGLLLRPRVDTLHQSVGIAVVGVLAAQALLGWLHHVRFVALGRRTWVSDAHVWVGRAVVPVACANLVLGLALAGWPRGHIVAAGVLVGLLLSGLGALVWWLKRRQR